MTKAELEKEAEEWTKDHSGLIGGYKFVKYDYDSMQKAYLASAEPREKQIQIDAEHIRALQKQNGELTDRLKELEAQIESLKGDLELWESGACRATNLDKCGVVKELEAQIEKMKCCENCRYCNEWGEANSNSSNCKKCNWVSNWKLRR